MFVKTGPDMKRILVLLAILGLSLPAVASRDDDDERHERHEGHGMDLSRADPVWLQECGSCHVAYPPGMLPAAHWKKVMAGLDKHFGSDASLSAKEHRQVSDYLQRNAGQNRAPANSLRITETDWFKRKHDEVRSEVWKRASVKSAANCQACHPAADKGDYSEHGPNGVRIPR
jgi:hypothetical protein